jgi:hypothetical protein
MQQKRKTQKSWEQKIQIELSCVITFGIQTISGATKTNIFPTSQWKVRNKVCQPM